jgi:ribosomal protein S12 methylthiotransferase
MHRPWDGDRYLKLFEKVRAAMPDCAIRTTFIVGFPGETEGEFQHMMDFTRAARLDRVGAFLFSKEPGTPAHDLEGQVAPRVKQERYDRLMRLQQGISLEKNEAWIGRDLDVIIEDARDGWLIGRSHRDAPEIDGLVFVQGEAEPGSIVTTRVTAAEHYDLYAEMTRVPVSVGRKLMPLRMAGPARPL